MQKELPDQCWMGISGQKHSFGSNFNNKILKIMHVAYNTYLELTPLCHSSLFLYPYYTSPS